MPPHTEPPAGDGRQNLLQHSEGEEHFRDSARQLPPSNSCVALQTDATHRPLQH